MKKIAKQTQQRLMQVVEKTAELVDLDGDSPNDAIIKAAGDLGLRPGEVRLVVRAYNTGRTNRQRLEGVDPMEKSAEFELADAQQVLERLYPSQIKTAAAKEQETAISTDYLFGPATFLQKRFAKQAAAVGLLHTEPAPPRMKAAEAYIDTKITFASRDVLKREYEKSRRKVAASYDQLTAAFTSLIDGFRTPDCPPLPAVEKVAEWLHGKSGALVLQQVRRANPLLFAKAKHRILDGEKVAESLAADTPPLPQVAEVVKLAEAYTELRTAHAILTAELEKRAAALVIDKAADPGQYGHSLLDGRQQARDKIASPMTNPLGWMGAYTMTQKTLNPSGKEDSDFFSDSSSLLSGMTEKLSDPDHEAKLREINSQATLTDLMSNDEVISGYDPEEVTAAYNDLVQLAPAIADQRILLQSMLRKRLAQGVLDPFEQEMLLRADKELRGQVQPRAQRQMQGVIDAQ